MKRTMCRSKKATLVYTVWAHGLQNAHAMGLSPWIVQKGSSMHWPTGPKRLAKKALDAGALTSQDQSATKKLHTHCHAAECASWHKCLVCAVSKPMV
jgi:hypothetical protein